MLGLYFYHKFCFHSRFPFFPTFTFRNWLRDAYYYSGRHENYWVQILGRIYDMKIWTHFNSGVLKVSFPPASVFVKVRIGEGAPCDFLFSLHIFTPIIYFWSFCWLPSFSIIFFHGLAAEELSVLIEDEVLSPSKEQRRGKVIIVERKLGEAGEVDVKLEDGGVPNWEPWRQPGGNTDNYTGAKFKIYTPLIVRSYHLENPLCITTWKMWK